MINLAEGILSRTEAKFCEHSLSYVSEILQRCRPKDPQPILYENIKKGRAHFWATSSLLITHNAQALLALRASNLPQNWALQIDQVIS